MNRAGKGLTVYEILAGRNSPSLDKQMLETKPLRTTPYEKEIWALSVHKENPHFHISTTQRIITISYRSAAIAGAIVIAVIFAVFCLGMLTGKSTTAHTITPTITKPPPQPQWFWSLRLYEWYDIKPEHVTAVVKNEVSALINELKRHGLSEAFWAIRQNKDTQSIILYYGKYPTPDSPEINSVSQVLKNFIYNKKKWFAGYLNLEKLKM